ncbi:hypothetical protein BZA05DRAFT_476080 [Tricharina praecox]|uniref:uncharacterized protein n=1 Tax=Tricharina praecox TaxID=43433 RepID=UPI00221EE6E7|nr:uncharacterized protein BZA05DRAFT_476080 [Tricharina praecox]KAI5846741.1 hypothetical protein BZA05DRAFT_476080 [Tricharina praecox]
MCDDLIAKHYLHSSPSHVVHPSPEEYTHFTLHPTKRTWLFLHDCVPDAVVSSLRPKWHTLNTYDPFLASWARSEGHEVSQLREMKLGVAAPYTTNTTSGYPTPSASPTTSSFPTSFYSSSPLPPKGYKAAAPLPTKAWFLAKHPHLANTVHAAGEQVFSVMDTSRSIPQRAGWITVLPDAESRRLYISNLEIMEPHRRRGLARWLVGEVVRWWAKAGQGEVWLTVFEDNAPARDLYELLGFVTVRNLYVVDRRDERRVVDE